MRILFISCILLFSITSYADEWTGFHDIGNAYTYQDADTLFVFLDGVVCPNAKNYFSINPNQNANAKQIVSMVLAAKLSSLKINILFDKDQSPNYCFVKGLQVL